jgi:hypothetical protein
MLSERAVLLDTICKNRGTGHVGRRQQHEPYINCARIPLGHHLIVKSQPSIQHGSRTKMCGRKDYLIYPASRVSRSNARRKKKEHGCGCSAAADGRYDGEFVAVGDGGGVGRVLLVERKHHGAPDLLQLGVLRQSPREALPRGAPRRHLQPRLRDARQVPRAGEVEDLHLCHRLRRFGRGELRRGSSI